MKLYLHYLSIHLKSAMQYKVSFFLTSLGQFLISFTGFLSVNFLLKNFNEVDGFTYSEVLLCFSIVLLSFSLSEIFVRGFDSFRSTISNYEFDRILVRPQNEILQVLCSKIELTRFTRVIQAVIMIAYAITNSNIDWTIFRAFILILMLLGGLAVFTGLFIIYASICFFTIDGLEFMNIFTDGTREFGKYPFSIYGKEVLRIFTYVVPLACFQYYPLLYILGRTQNPLYAITPLFCFLFLIPSLLLWKYGVSHYCSTGS